MHRLPLDFFSWHFYTLDADDPYSFVPIARQLRIILDSHGFGSTKNILDEWNADPSEHDMTNASQAAFAASALIYMLGGPFDAQTYHRAAAELRGKDGESDSVGRALERLRNAEEHAGLIRTDGRRRCGICGRGRTLPG